MSTVSQTPPHTDNRRRWLIAAGFTTAVLGVVLFPARAFLAQAVQQAHVHAPNLSLIANLSLAIKIHLGAALAALVLGAALMIVRKGRTFHRVAGWTWVGIVAITAGSTLFITSLRPGHYSFLHLFTGWTLIILPIAVMWAKRRQIAKHRRNMMGLFYGGFAINLFIAFIPGRTMWEVFFG